MEDFTNPYERLLSSAASGSPGGGAGYRAGSGVPPPAAPPPTPPQHSPFGDHLHVRTVHDALAAAGRYLPAPGGLSFLGSLYGSNPPSPFRTTSAGSASNGGLVNTRTFWPPTPPPDAYSRCGVAGGYYPMFSSPLVPTSDMSFNCQGLLPRLPAAASSSPFSHLLAAANHKDVPFLPLRLNSPVTPSHPLGVPPYLHLPTPSLDHRYPSTLGLYSPLALHGSKTSPLDPPSAKLSDSDLQPAEKVVKSEPLGLSSSGAEKERPLMESIETKRKPSPKVASIKAREKHEIKGHGKASALGSGHRRGTAPTPGASSQIMMATVSPCVVATSGRAAAKRDPVKCSKCLTSMDEARETNPLKREVKDCSAACAAVKPFLKVVAPVSHATETSASATTAATVMATTGSNATGNGNGVSTVTHSARNSLSEKELPTVCPSTSETENIMQKTSTSPHSDKQVVMPQPKDSPLHLKKDTAENSAVSPSDTLKDVPSSTSVALPPVGNSLETHVSTVCTFSSWVHHQTSVTSVIQKEESDACLHAMQSSSQTTVVNLSLDKNLPAPAASPKTPTSQSKNRTLIFQTKNTRNAQSHQMNEATDEMKSALKLASKCEMKELTEPSQNQAMNLTVDRKRIPKLEQSNSVCDTTAKQQSSGNCDMKNVLETTATQSLDALSRLAKSPSGSARSSPAINWNTLPNKVKPSSVVTAIQSENLQPPLTKKSPEVMPCTPIVAGSIVSSPSVMSSDKSKEVTMRTDVKLPKVSSILGHDPSTISSISSNANTISAPSSIPVGIAVAQLRQDSSTISIKKAIVKANSGDLKVSPYTIPAMVDKPDKRFLKASIAPVTDTTMIVNPTASLGQWDSGAAVIRPATLSGSWLTPATSAVVTPTVWLGQAPTFQTPAHLSHSSCLGATVHGTLMETTSTAVPPVGYQLARDPISGHLFLIPTQNIELVDRSNIWSTYTPNSIQQVISHFPTTMNGTKKELKPLLATSHLMEKSELPLIQPRLLPSDQTLTQEIKEIKGMNTAVQSSVTSITVQTGQPFTFPSFTAAHPQPTLSYFYDQPTIVHLAPSQSTANTMTSVTPVPAEPGKRSQGTSPLNPMTPSPPPQHCSQVSEYESDAESMTGSETSTKPLVGVTASCQVDMDANSNDTDYEERSIEVFDSANQTDNLLMDSFKEDQNNASLATLVLYENEGEKMSESDRLDDIKLESNEESSELVIGNIDTEEEETATPILPTESKPVIDFIDQHGLNLLVDSIEEFASREDPNIPKSVRNVRDFHQLNTNCEFSIDPSCTDGLGLLCALAEQRFLEETKTIGDGSRARSCSPEPYQVDHSAVYRESKSQGQSRASRSGSRCHSPVLLNPAELEMRFKLAELQRKYKMKQMELARLKPRKDRDSSSSESSGPLSHWSTARDVSDDWFHSQKMEKSSSEHSCNVSCKAAINHLGEGLQHKQDSLTLSESVASSSSEPPDTESLQLDLDALPSRIPDALPTEELIPNLGTVATNKYSKSRMDSPSSSTLPKFPTSNSKKRDKDLFQLWKEKKLEALSRTVPVQLPAPRQQTSIEPNLSLQNGEAGLKKKLKRSPSKKNCKNELDDAMDDFLMKEEVSKKTVDLEIDHLEGEACVKKQNFESKLEEMVDNIIEHEESKGESIPEKVSEELEKSERKASTEQKVKKREKRPSITNDDIWNRRRSERIFLHDAGVILPTSLTYNSKTNKKSNIENQKEAGKCLKHEELKRKKMTRKEFSLKKIKLQDEKKQNEIPSLEMFLAMRQCRLGEMRYNSIPGVAPFAEGLGLAAGGRTPMDDSSGSEGDLPLSILMLEKKNLVIPVLLPCQMQVSDLRDCQRVLMEEDGLYYAGYITAIQAPDVYGITLDRERGNRPHIFSREEMFQHTVKEVCPVHVKQIPAGTRVCAYWSQQYRCLYPGTVTKGNSEVPAQEKNTVFVEFDDGDSGRIPLQDVRLLVPDPDCEPSSRDLGDTQIQSEKSQKEPETKTIDICHHVQSEIVSLVGPKEPFDTELDSNISSNTLQQVESDSSQTKLGAKIISSKSPKTKPIMKSSFDQETKLKNNKSKKSTKSKTDQKLKSKTKCEEISVVAFPSPPSVESVKAADGSASMELMSEPSPDIKPEKIKKISKLEEKKISKLKKSSFLLKKPKHRFTDASGSLKSSVLEKIKNCMKKSRKNKSDSKEKNKVNEENLLASPADGKVKKRKKHKTEHKHHHKHHKRHCHHHHKKHKRKGNSVDPPSCASDGCPGLTISVGPEPKEVKDSLPMCCISPGRSELTVKIKASPSYTGLMTETVFSPASIKANKDKGTPQGSEREAAFSFECKSTEKSVSEAKSDGESNKEAASEKKSPKKRKERKISCEKSKIAAFLPARQLWRWSGKSFKRPGTKGKAKKEYFKAITRGKETINVGDCAVFLSTGRPHLPYVGRIETMWQSWGGNTVVKVKWFYHPEETKGGKKLIHPKGALFQSPHVDENDVQTISHKCEVLSWDDYQKWGEKRTSSGGTRMGYENEDIYYLAGNYEPLAKVLTLEPGVS